MIRRAAFILLAGVSTLMAADVSEEARRAFIKGSAAAKAAKSADQQLIAVKHFEAAVRLAPNWGDALYNLAVAQELAGRYADAQATLKRYIKTNPGQKEVRKAQDKIYALEAQADVAAAASAEESAKKEQAWRQDLEGAVFLHELNTPDDHGNMIQMRKYSADIQGGVVTVHRWSNPQWFGVGHEPDARCKLDGLSCETGIVGGPVTRTMFVIAPDARSAELVFYAGQTIMDRMRFNRQ